MKDGDIYLYRLLERAGWYEGRKLDHEYISDIVKIEGYAQLPNVINFLQEFMNIKLFFENKRNGLKYDDISFLFEEATNLVVPERVNEEYAFRIGKALCLIGSAYREHMVLLMSNDGCVYAGYDNFLCKVADSGIEAIKAIVYDYDFVTLP